LPITNCVLLPFNSFNLCVKTSWATQLFKNIFVYLYFSLLLIFNNFDYNFFFILYLFIPISLIFYSLCKNIRTRHFCNKLYNKFLKQMLTSVAKVEKYCWKMCISLFKSQNFDYFNAKLPLLVSLTSAPGALVSKTQFLMYKHYFPIIN
jgi:hypothetical protein